MGMGGQGEVPAAINPRKEPVHIVKEYGWVPGTFCIGAKILARTGIRSTDLPVRNESLYQLGYSGNLRL